MKLPKSKPPLENIDEFNPFPDLKPKEVKKRKVEYIIFSIALLVFLGSLGVYLTLDKSPSDLSASYPDQAQQVSATPTPTPKPLPTGNQVYNLSHGKDVVGPKLTKIILNPIDPKQGEEIIITAHITHDSDVTSAQVDIITDNSSLPLKLKLIDGDESNGTWQTKAKVKDTYDYNYYIKFNLESSTGNYDGGLKLR